jgi:dipeptidyl aminopeptidase/acylaminoacyl peptidase
MRGMVSQRAPYGAIANFDGRPRRAPHTIRDVGETGAAGRPAADAIDGHLPGAELSMRATRRLSLALVCGLLLVPAPASAQGTIADYQRAMTLRDRYQDLTPGIADQVRWIEKTNRLYYRKSVKGGHEWVLVDAPSAQKRPAFDHTRLAAGIAAAANRKATAVTLPFNTFNFVDGEKAIEFVLAEPGAAGRGGGGRGGFGPDDPVWRCSLDTYTCRQPERAGRGGRGGRGGGGLAGPVRPPFDINGVEPKKSPDGKLEAIVNNYNVAIRETGKREVTLLSTDGSEGGYYDGDSLAWSPDSTRIAVYKVKPGFRRFINYIQSSPEDQLQPKHSTMQYAKPGDVLDVETPVLFEVSTKKRIAVDTALFPNAYDVSSLQWRKDSRAVTFEYNQRGHQLYRVIEIAAADGRARAVISEEPGTFFCYSGKKYRFDVDDGKEVVWMSERDGWNHLYLVDGATGAVKNQITRGDWAVRSVVETDEKKRQIVFTANGMYPGKDPYFVHVYRINFDGTGLTPLTPADANHTASFSPDSSFYVDTYSRVDQPPIAELRRASDGSRVMELERADAAELVKAGWKAPEVFVAKGRDGRTDIWGVIYRPTNFDPAKKYPVIENIYAGPQGAFVPKSFAAFNQMQAQAEIGFIVVQIDGMGTNYRSKAFHDVAWKNLKDAGFPDRILWHKAAAAKYPSYDITRVGLYGTSAGGQNSLGGLLFFPEFYKAAVSSVGCHDNRMDKIWWNEQWMGWPIGSEYAESSNVDNAYRLQGKVLLVVGEMDQNVDPSSTMQVVNQLIKHNKEFDLLVIPGAGHGSGGAYGDHKRFDFFTRHLLGVTPPAWKAIEDATKKSTTSTSALQ